jgi:serpin B
VDGNLYIRGLRHKAYVGVGEEGTEAAAATGVAVGDDDDADWFIFHANHPFLFLIRDRQTGAILFLGRVSLPSA